MDSTYKFEKKKPYFKYILEFNKNMLECTLFQSKNQTFCRIPGAVAKSEIRALRTVDHKRVK